MKTQKSLQLRPTPFMQKSSSIRGRKQNGNYFFNRREIDKLVSMRTIANALGKERPSKDCIWISEVCWVPANHVIITRQIGYLSSRRQLLIPAQAFQGLFRQPKASVAPQRFIVTPILIIAVNSAKFFYHRWTVEKVLNSRDKLAWVKTNGITLIRCWNALLAETLEITMTYT